MKRFPYLHSLLALIGFAILCTLGTWQVQRLEWKQDLIEKLEQDYQAGEENRARFMPQARLQELAREQQPIAYGMLEGRLRRHDAVLVGPRTLNGKMGYHLIMPLDMANNEIILINTGWVDALWKDNTRERLAFLPADNITVRGVIRKPDWSSFASKNSPANDMWFRPDIVQIAQEKQISVTYPFMIYAENINPALHDVVASEEHWLPRNKHLQYAIFWYAMAGALLLVFSFYLRSRK
jgi:surfeit locus 1 family protein